MRQRGRQRDPPAAQAGRRSPSEPHGTAGGPAAAPRVGVRGRPAGPFLPRGEARRGPYLGGGRPAMAVTGPRHLRSDGGGAARARPRRCCRCCCGAWQPCPPRLTPPRPASPPALTARVGAGPGAFPTCQAPNGGGDGRGGEAGPAEPCRGAAGLALCPGRAVESGTRPQHPGGLSAPGVVSVRVSVSPSASDASLKNLEKGGCSGETPQSCFDCFQAILFSCLLLAAVLPSLPPKRVLNILCLG